MDLADAQTIVEELTQNNTVFVFSKTYCPFCTQVKQLFNKLNIQFRALELDIDKDGEAILKVLIKKTGSKTVPSVFINGTYIGGCDSTLKAHQDGTLMALINRPKVHTYDFDLIVIGGGSGGLAAAKEAALLGKRVAVFDHVYPSPHGTTWGLGGTCVNVGCIPKKLMHQAALLGASINDARAFGWNLPETVEHSWGKMAENIKSHIQSLNWGYRIALRDNKIVYFNSRAQFEDPHRVKTRDKKGVIQDVTAETFIVAVGGRPTYPNDVVGARQHAISSDDLFWLPASPGKTLLIGASYIALECAGFLAGLGLDVTVMVRSILLRGFDRQMAEMIGKHMEDHGVKFLMEHVPESIEQISAGPPKILRVKGTNKEDNSEYQDDFNTVIFAIGRYPCTDGIGLEEIGVQLHEKSKKIVGDAREQSSIKNIYAIGDVLHGTPELTPVAIQAGRLLVRRLYGNSELLTDYTNVPTTVFTPLEYGCVGLSEEDAFAKFGAEDIEVYHSHFQPLEYQLSQRDVNKCYAKLICVKSQNERVVGFHVFGPNAGEVTQGFSIGLKLGAKKSDFAGLVGIHPTCAEIFTTMSVTKASGKRVDKVSC